MHEPQSSHLCLLKNRIDLKRIPFTDRGSRILLYAHDHHFSIRLAERWVKRDHRLSAYRQRVPIMDDIFFLDANGNPLQVNITTYPHCVVCSTTCGEFIIFFADTETLQIILPTRTCGISFLAHINYAQTDRRGGTLHLTGDIRRNISYTTNAAILSNQITLLSAEAVSINLQVHPHPQDSLLINITPRLGFNRYIHPPFKGLEAAARTWHEWFACAPAVISDYSRQYTYAWWIMRAGLISTRFYTTREAMTPSKEYYVGVWQWDALFHALAFRHIDPRLAQDQIRILLDHQQADGMIPDAIHDEGLVTHLDFPVNADVTKPPLIAWAALKLFETNPDIEFLQEIYQALCHWTHWWFDKNDLDHDGLCEYQHPFSSGMDNHPLWDGGMPVTSPDLNTYLVLQQENLAHIANLIGEKKDARLWKKAAHNQAAKMNKKMWNKKEGIFQALYHNRPVACRSITGLLPLLTGELPGRMAASLVRNLTDPAVFWADYPLATVALHDATFDPEDMWRGPTWVNMNYLLIEGLQRSNYPEVARVLRQRTLDMIAGLDDIYEYYHPLNGSNPPKSASIFGWSAAIFIDLALQLTREKEGEKP